MEAAGQMVVPVLSMVAAAAITFYAVSFNELREKSLRELDTKLDAEEGDDGGGFRSSASSRERRARRKAEKAARKQ